MADTAALAGGKAPPGVCAVLGNHAWWDDRARQWRRAGTTLAGLALEANGFPVLENRAVRLGDGAGAFWLAGPSDQLALADGRGRFSGVDDLPGTLAQIADDGAPVVMLAHEPDIFPKVPDRVAVMLSGHALGGQVRLLGNSPIVPSRFGNRYAHGQVRQGGRDLGVSGASAVP